LIYKAKTHPGEVPELAERVPDLPPEPPEPPCYVPPGALVVDKARRIHPLPPASEAADRVTPIEEGVADLSPGAPVVIGIDLGSIQTTSTIESALREAITGVAQSG